MSILVVMHTELNFLVIGWFVVFVALMLRSVMFMGKTRLFGKSFQEKKVSAKLVKRVTLVVKVRFNRNRSQGARIESLPLKSLLGLSKLPLRSWRLEQFGDKFWLILEAA